MHTINNMIIAIDFDGTCVTHEYPKIGKDIGAVPVLKKLLKNGNNIILYTMRSGKELIDAVDWFNKNEISLYGVNTNPSQSSWTLSPKVYAHIYIDDSALGVPIIVSKEHKPYVDWIEVEKLLKEKGVINE